MEKKGTQTFFFYSRKQQKTFSFMFPHVHNFITSFSFYKHNFVHLDLVVRSLASWLH